MAWLSRTPWYEFTTVLKELHGVVVELRVELGSSLHKHRTRVDRVKRSLPVVAMLLPQDHSKLGVLPGAGIVCMSDKNRKVVIPLWVLHLCCIVHR